MVPHYNFYSTNIASNKGGVCLFVRNDLKCKVRQDLCISKEYLETIFVETIIDNKTVIIGMLYHRPGTSTDLFLNDLKSSGITLIPVIPDVEILREV